MVLDKANKITEILGGNVEKYYDIVEKNVNLSVNDIVEKIVS